ncbi:LacI family DNA-binding transcriptional regulator [Cellulomonas endophytica]|uniref:LacI family DNA-binding transcriptional regulator n=1 Tax=Cellulomonas endophytica TaxID=2494735 RepID=UPI001011AAE4|nr:LacI family DNA-binding transcriptional regulator [Cellulomonas endophytica]
MTGGRVTSHDVARRAGVSRSTVSYVLNDTPGQTIPPATRARVHAAVAELGYRPSAAARVLRRGRSDWVVLLLPPTPVGPALSLYTDALVEALDRHGMTAVVRRHTTAQATVDLARELAPAAVVTLAGLDGGSTRRLEDDGVVVVDTTQDHPGLLGSHGLHLAVGTAQAEHLLGCGYRRLGYALPEDPSLARIAALRVTGVREVCTRASVGPPDAHVVPLDVAGAVAAVDRWTGAAAVDAVAAYNDDVALALLAGLRERRVDVPGRLAVVGADDLVASRFATPPLSTVDLRPALRGRTTARVVLGRLGRPSEEDAVAGADSLVLVARASTARR